MSRFFIACGGTGGHLAPGIAIAERLQKRKHACTLLISRKQVDSMLIRKYDHLNFVRCPGRAFAGSVLALPAAVLELLSGFFFSLRLIHRERPALVLLFGGFLSVGLGLAARLLGIPVAVHEANCRPGRAVRLLKPLATRLYLPEGVRFRGLSGGRVRHYGYPVREDVRHITKAESRRRLDVQVEHKLLVVIGGSQGASSLNDWVTAHFEELARDGVSVYCVTGLGKGTGGRYECETGRGGHANAVFVPFTDAMGDVLSAADLVVSRAGAGAIAELVRCRAPAILVPYPYAADDHQEANARTHERHGACLVLPEDQIDRLLAEVRDLIFNDWLLGTFKQNLERLDGRDPADLIVRDLLALADAGAESGRAVTGEAAT